MTTTTETRLDRAALEQFTGGGDQFQHWLRRVRYTEGVKYLAETHGAYWLIDAIASHQGCKVDAACGSLQFWTLTVNADRSARLVCRRDKGEPACVSQAIEFTDFPATGGEPLALWVCDCVLMLPGEY